MGVLGFLVNLLLQRLGLHLDSSLGLVCINSTEKGSKTYLWRDPPTCSPLVLLQEAAQLTPQLH